MSKVGGGIKSGFLPMVLAILGLVLFVNMFTTVMTALTTLSAISGISTFIAMPTLIGIAPTVLLLGGIGAAGFAYWRGYQLASSGGDTGGLMRMVLGVLMVILFITLFGTVATNFYSLYTTYGGNTSWIAFGTVVTVMPTVLFIGGIFAGVGTAVSGYRSRRKRRALR